MTNFNTKQIAILGWGIDTEDIVPYLLHEGAVITVFDRKNKLETKYTHEINWRLGSEDFGNLSKFDLIVRNPAIYRLRPEIVIAEKAGVEISSKTKIFFDLCPAKIIGVTGTKGKGTTATLIYEILKAAGKDIYLGGNIGTGVFEFLPKLTSESWVVLELSSFQLIDLHKSPHIAVVLMVTSEHLDWHASDREYVEAKKPIVLYQTPTDFAVVNKDYAGSVTIGETGRGQKIWVSGHNINLKTRLRGDHNKENIVAAMTVAKIIGVPYEQTIAKFKGLEHRLEEVTTINGITFYNDSFSTTPETAIAAIKSFTEPIILIAGGSDKGSDFTELGKTIIEQKNVKVVILVGLMTSRIQTAVKAFARGPLAKGVMTTQVITGAKNMAEIVKMAYNNATSGDIVLLSPACASFDMFKSYKDRGEQFKKEVLSLREA